MKCKGTCKYLQKEKFLYEHMTDKHIHTHTHTHTHTGTRTHTLTHTHTHTCTHTHKVDHFLTWLALSASTAASKVW